MPDSFDRNRIIHIDFAAVLVSRGDLFGRSVAIFHRTEWGREKREGRGYGAGHQGDLQALSHYRVFNLDLAKTDLTFACCYPEPEGEFSKARVTQL